jgi:hypothetical protein
MFGIVFLSIFLIGIYCIPCLLAWIVFVVVDGYKIAERLKSGIPVMQGECSNKWAAVGLSTFSLIHGPVFDNTDPSTCPHEWTQNMKKFGVVA